MLIWPSLPAGVLSPALWPTSHPFACSGRTGQHVPTQVFSLWPALHTLATEKASLIPLVKINCPLAYSYAFFKNSPSFVLPLS